MATAILDKLLQSQFGKSFIFWVFIAMCIAVAALANHSLHQARELKDCNNERVSAEKGFSTERERILRESITLYQSILQRLETVEKNRKKK